MSKYILNFSELNSDVDVVSFTSAKKRANYIAERVIGSNPKRVFTLVVSYDDNDDYDNACDVYVFDQWTCIKEVVQQRWKSFWLFEWSSYEDAYKNALDIKDVSPLCYS